MMSYNWSEMEGRDILQAFADDPAALQNCEWGKITPLNWVIILKKMPELAGKCDWKTLSTWHQMRILLEQPQLVGFADTKAMSGDEIVEIFSKHKVLHS